MTGRRDILGRPKQWAKMCNAYNHPANCGCGWGGEYHGGIASPVSAAARVEGLRPDGTSGAGLCWNAVCPVCQADVFFVRHNGGCVWLDDLGPPWPRHGCFDDPRRPHDPSLARPHTALANISAGCNLLRVNAVENEAGVPLDDPFPCELLLCPMCTCHAPTALDPAESILLRRGDLVTRDMEGMLWLLFSSSRIPVTEERNELLIEARWRASIKRDMGFAELMYGNRVIGYGPFPPTPSLDPVALRLLKWMRGMLDGQKGTNRFHWNINSVAMDLRKLLIANHSSAVEGGLVMVHELDALFCNTHVGLREGATDSNAVISSAIDLKGKPVPACFSVSTRVDAAATAYLGLTKVRLRPPLTTQEVLEEDEAEKFRQLGPWGISTGKRASKKPPREEKDALAWATQMLLAQGDHEATDEAKRFLKTYRRNRIWKQSSFIERGRCCRAALERSGHQLDWNADSCAETTRLVFRHVLAASACDPSVDRDANAIIVGINHFGNTSLPGLLRNRVKINYTLAEGLSALIRQD